MTDGCKPLRLLIFLEEPVLTILSLSGLGSLATSTAGVTATVGTAAGTAAGGVTAAGGTTGSGGRAAQRAMCVCIALLHGFPYVRSCTLVHAKFSSLLCLCPNSCLMSICQQGAIHVGMRIDTC